jgi:hypothetical protein
MMTGWRQAERFDVEVCMLLAGNEQFNSPAPSLTHIHKLFLGLPPPSPPKMSLACSLPGSAY